MIDRELLELAAKAAGIPVVWHDEADCLMRIDKIGTVPWNPLADDADALRLAVKLQIQVTPGTYNKDEFTAYNSARHAEAHEHRSYLQDEGATTRRVIVRAAAEIGGAHRDSRSTNEGVDTWPLTPS